MIANAAKPIADRPWLDPQARPQIVIDSVSKTYGATTAVDNVSLNIFKGEMFALVGASGCGKTTLLRIVGGLDKDFAGELEWRGSKPPRIGNVFQEPRLLPWRTVRENILLAQQAFRPEIADELLEKLGLTPFRDAFPRRLSLGMARRVAIARAFAIEPELVLLDEPFVSLDPAMAEKSRQVLLNAWHTRPIAALLVTHDHDEAALLADRILVMDGQPACIMTELAVPQGDGAASSRR